MNNSYVYIVFNNKSYNYYKKYVGLERLFSLSALNCEAYASFKCKPRENNLFTPCIKTQIFP